MAHIAHCSPTKRSLPILERKKRPLDSRIRTRSNSHIITSRMIHLSSIPPNNYPTSTVPKRRINPRNRLMLNLHRPSRLPELVTKHPRLINLGIMTPMGCQSSQYLESDWMSFSLGMALRFLLSFTNAFKRSIYLA